MEEVLNDGKKANTMSIEASKIKDRLNPCVIYKNWEDYVNVVLGDC
jgi:hypothetical protein